MKIFDSDILKQIHALERNQLRSMSDLLANPNDAKARAHFDARKARIDELRVQLSGNRKPTAG